MELSGSQSLGSGWWEWAVRTGRCLLSVCFPSFVGGWLGPLIPYCMSHQVGNVHGPCPIYTKPFLS